MLIDGVVRSIKLARGETIYRADGRIKVDAKIVHGAPDGWFLPGAGKTEWFKDLDVGPEMLVVPAGEFTMGSNDAAPTHGEASIVFVMRAILKHLLNLWRRAPG